MTALAYLGFLEVEIGKENSYSLLEKRGQELFELRQLGLLMVNRRPTWLSNITSAGISHSIVHHLTSICICIIISNRRLINALLLKSKTRIRNFISKTHGNVTMKINNNNPLEGVVFKVPDIVVYVAFVELDG